VIGHLLAVYFLRMV